MAERLVYRDGGVILIGELYRPAASPNGRAVVVVHEADGIGGNVRRRCEMLSELGYIALAADMHGEGKVLDSDEIMPAMERFKANPALLRDRIQAAVDALITATAIPAMEIAAIGYCFGGLAVLELARAGSPLCAVASFHGLLTSKAPAGPGSIATRILACTGALDPLVPPRDVATFQHEMLSAEADWQLIIYGQALHSFTNEAVGALNDPRMAYDAAADRQSWAALMRFLDESFRAVRS